MLQNAYYTANYVRWSKKFAVGGRKIIHADIIIFGIMLTNVETAKGLDMPVTLSVPPKVVRDVESFAARSGTTLDALVLAYLVKTATEERRTRSKRSRNPVLKFCGICPRARRSD